MNRSQRMDKQVSKNEMWHSHSVYTVNDLFMLTCSITTRYVRKRTNYTLNDSEFAWTSRVSDLLKHSFPLTEAYMLGNATLLPHQRNHFQSWREIKMHGKPRKNNDPSVTHFTEEETLQLSQQMFSPLWEICICDLSCVANLLP